ncbi:MAG: PAS domain S-box protein [Nitrospira sp.]|nr:PAS domain S-box protein [Nitrospira sp.]
MDDPLDSAQDLSTELQQLRCSVLELQRELLTQKSKETKPVTSLAHFTALSHMLESALLFENAARRITFINETFCAMFDISEPDSLIGLDSRAAIERVQAFCADPTRFLSQIERVVGGQVPLNGEEIRLADGRWLVQDYAPVMVDGTCAWHVWSYRDITERKRTKIALSESESRFRMMEDTAQVLIWVAGPDKLCTYFNQGWLDYTGRTLEQELGNGWAEGVHPDDLARCLKTYEEAFDRREPFQMEYRLRKANGEYGWILDSGTPRRLPNGGFAGYISSGIDITEQKQAQAVLESIVRGTASVTGEEFFQVLVQQLAATLDARFSLVTKLVGGSRTRLRTLAVWHGAGPGRNFEYDTRGTPCEVVLAQGSACYLTGVCALFPDDQDLVKLEAEGYLGHVLRDAQGVPIGHLCVVTKAPLRIGDQGLSIMAVFAARAAAELERKQAEETLRRSYEERERISHDLHDGILQSLYAIGLGLEAMKRRVKPATRVLLEQLDDSIMQLNALVREVRGFITHMTMPAEDTWDITQTLQALRGAFAATEAGDIAIQVEPAVAASFSSEQSAHLVKFVREALSNSMRHAHAARRSVTLGRSRKGIRLEIRDDGVGFRVSQRRGVGMGLSTMQARAKKLGGRLSIISRPGRGTRVALDLPRNPPSS